MKSENLRAEFKQLLNFDVNLWSKGSWPSKEDDACRDLLTQFSELEQPEQILIAEAISALRLEKPLELYAFRCGKFGKTREDFKNACYALLFCQSKERILVERFLAETAKNVGVSIKKIKKELPLQCRGL